MLRYIISSFLIVLVFNSTIAQNDSIPQDSVKYTQKYGLRVGGDIGKLIRTAIDDDYSGFEINADYRIKSNLFIAGEIGFEEKTTYNDFLNSTSKGGYLKGGVDFNLYQNWFGMDNLIYFGFRGGYATFEQTVNSYTPYNTNQSWQQPVFTESINHDGLSATWGELIIGIKAELFNNLFIGLNAQLKGRVSETEPENFENIFVPGFGRTYDSGSFGMGYGYNISYLIPLYKKGSND